MVRTLQGSSEDSERRCAAIVSGCVAMHRDASKCFAALQVHKGKAPTSLEELRESPLVNSGLAAPGRRCSECQHD